MSLIVTKRIEQMLKDSGFEHEITEHGPVYTSEEAANVRGVELRTGVKALVLKTTDGNFILGLCPADKRVDLKKLAGIEGVKRLRLASPEEVKKVTDCGIGSVPHSASRRS